MSTTPESPTATAAEAIPTPTVQPHTFTDNGDRVLILRRISKDGMSHGGFAKWGAQSELNITVQPEVWNPTRSCGNGIHGWPWGIGLGDGADYDICNDRWLVVSAKPEDVVGELEGGWKCKCREVVKIFDGTYAEAWKVINDGRHRCIQAMSKADAAAATAASGDYSQLAASGDSSQLAASGDYSKLAASGDYSKLAASGDYSKLAASGDSSKLAASGDYSKLAASGHSSQLAASGDSSQLAASGHSSKLAASGDYSQLAASGDSSKLAALGKSSIVAGIADSCDLAVGELGCIIATYWKQTENRYRVVVGYVGENGIKPNTRYKLNDRHEFEEVKE